MPVTAQDNQQLSQVQPNVGEGEKRAHDFAFYCFTVKIRTSQVQLQAYGQSF